MLPCSPRVGNETYPLFSPSSPSTSTPDSVSYRSTALILLHLLLGLLCLLLDLRNHLFGVVEGYPGDLDHADAAEEEVNRGEAAHPLAYGIPREKCTYVCVNLYSFRGTLGGERLSRGIGREGARAASQVVLGGDDHAPSRPDETGGGQGQVLSDGELLDGTSEVGDTGNDE